MKKATLLTLALLAAAAIPCHAQWYAGGALGQSRANLDAGDRSSQFVGLGFDAAATGVDKTDTAARVFGGYRLQRFVAVELGYQDLGEYRIVTDVLPAGYLASRSRVSGFDASVLGLLPLGDRFTLFARGGVLAGRSTVSFDSGGSVRTNNDSNRSGRHTGALYGAGAMIKVAPRVDLRLDWTKYQRVGDDGINSRRFDTSAWMIGAAYRF